ncbi:MAG: hypothetical protein HQL76_02285 [Magnetococcales bacterium]|nr:hypothetical protein [Magnetococcales bacterium]
MPRSIQWPLQAVFYTAFFTLVYIFSVSPGYHYLEPGRAELKLAFKHAAQRMEACRERSREELQRLAPNMRKPKECSRKRAPLLVELLLDGNILASKTFPPPGIQDDGTAYVYAKYPIPDGDHRLSIRMRDSNRSEGFDYVEEKQIVTRTSTSLVIGFDGAANRFIFY